LSSMKSWWLVMTVLAGCGPGFKSLKADSIAKLEVSAGDAGGICGRPKEPVVVVVTATTKDGKQVRTAIGEDTQGKLDPKLFVFKTTIGKIDRTGMLRLPANPLAMLGPAEVTVHHKDAAKPAARTALTFRFDCEASTSFRGGDGAYGGEHYQYYGTGNAAPSGSDGGPGGMGGSGGNGASVEIHVGWLDVGDGRRLALADVTDGSRREFYLLDPQGKGLVVDVSGGAGGAGGYGQSGGVSGNYEDPGTAGGTGGDGGNGGNAGSATVFVEDESLNQLIWVKADPGAGGNGGEGGPGGPESDNADSTRKVPGGPAGANGNPGNPGNPGAQTQMRVVPSPTADLVAAAGGMPKRVAPPPAGGGPPPPGRPTPRPGAPTPMGRPSVTTTPPGHTPPPPPPGHTPPPAQGNGPVPYSGELVVTMTVLKPSKAKPVSSTATGTARLSKEGGKNKLEFGPGCTFDLGAHGAVKHAVCDQGQVLLSGLGGKYKLSAAGVSLEVSGKFAFKPNQKGEKVASGKVTLSFHGKP